MLRMVGGEGGMGGFVSEWDGGRGEREVGGVEAMVGVGKVGGKWVKGGNGIYIR